MITATSAATIPNNFCSTDCATNCAVRPPRKLPPAVATSSSIPSFMLISCLPARPAETLLDVAITVVRLIAAAAVNGKPSTRLRNGTRKTPPPSPSSAPRLPEITPAVKMIAASEAVTTGITRTRPAGGAASCGRKRARLRQVARRLLDRRRLGFLARRSVGAREPRAGIDVRNRAVIHVAEPVGFDRHLPAGQFLLPPRVLLW